MRCLLFFFLLFFFFSCGNDSSSEVVVKGQTAVRLPVSPKKLEGMYSGEFKGSPLTVVLTRVSDKHAIGYNMHKGVTRNLTGVVAFTEGRLNLYLVEPGDSRYDGAFHLSIDTSNWKGEGSWTSFVTDTKVLFRFRKRDIPKEEEGQVFVDAFANFITLKSDGTCFFNYLDDSTTAAPPLILTGRYKKDQSKITIHWKKNPLFPTGKSVFYLFSEKAFKSESYTPQSLRGEGKVFNEMLF